MTVRIWFNIIGATPEQSIKIASDLQKDLSQNTDKRLEQLVLIHRQVQSD